MAYVEEGLVGIFGDEGSFLGGADSAQAEVRRLEAVEFEQVLFLWLPFDDEHDLLPPEALLLLEDDGADDGVDKVLEFDPFGRPLDQPEPSQGVDLQDYVHVLLLVEPSQVGLQSVRIPRLDFRIRCCFDLLLVDPQPEKLTQKILTCSWAFSFLLTRRRC